MSIKYVHGGYLFTAGALAVGVGDSGINEGLHSHSSSTKEICNIPTNQSLGDNIRPTTSSGRSGSQGLKRKSSSPALPETDETKELTTVELQRLVLLEQLKLIRMQQQEINDRKDKIHTDMETNNTYLRL